MAVALGSRPAQFWFEESSNQNWSWEESPDTGSQKEQHGSG